LPSILSHVLPVPGPGFHLKVRQTVFFRKKTVAEVNDVFAAKINIFQFNIFRVHQAGCQYPVAFLKFDPGSVDPEIDQLLVNGDRSVFRNDGAC
jgi:hypothetical protein